MEWENILMVVKYYKDDKNAIEEIQSNYIPSHYLAHMLVRCTDKFIEDSWKLPNVINNKIICKSYDGPINEPVKNFSYLKDLIKCKIKLLISYIQ